MLQVYPVKGFSLLNGHEKVQLLLVELPTLIEFQQLSRLLNSLCVLHLHRQVAECLVFEQRHRPVLHIQLVSVVPALGV
jgi:hypothetical protein